MTPKGMSELVERYFLGRDVPAMTTSLSRVIWNGRFLCGITTALDHDDWENLGLAFRERLAAAEPRGVISMTVMRLSITPDAEVEIAWEHEKDGRFFWPDNHVLELTAAEAESIFGESGETAA
jgi:hypothetical protein